MATERPVSGDWKTLSQQETTQEDKDWLHQLQEARENCEYQHAMPLRIQREQTRQQLPSPLQPLPSEQLLQQPLPTMFQTPRLTQLQRLYKPAPYQRLNEWQKQIKWQVILEFEEEWRQAHQRGLASILANQMSPHPVPDLKEEATERLRLRMIAIKRVMRRGGYPDYQPCRDQLDPTFFGDVDAAVKNHLLAHFRDHTSTAFNVDPIDRRVSDNILSKTAFDLSFQNSTLMNAMMALSALHIKHMRIAEPELIRNLAIWYSRAAMAQYVADVEIANPDSIPHLLVASLLMTAVASESFREVRVDNTLCILSWIKLWSGIGVMMQRVTVTGLINHGLSKLFYRPPFNTEGAAKHAPYALSVAASFFIGSDEDVQHRELLLEVLKCIGVLYKHLRDGLSPMMRLRIITWFTFLPAGFIDLVMQKNARALVFVAHYAIFLKLTTRVWWMENVGQKTIEQLVPLMRDSYGSFYEYLVETPEKALHTNDIDELGRLLLEDNEWVHEPRPFTPEEMMYWGVRETFVNDAGRAILPHFPELVSDGNTAGGVAVATWHSGPQWPDPLEDPGDMGDAP
ncbi:hypothetical protein PWT90_03060 [Aphanocladium album]|nr:hypothetical protein PWT90_03060 [Aphanocladium album]